MLPRTTQQSYSAALVRESQIEPWLAFANTLLAGAKSSHGTTQPKMNPQPDLRSGTKVDAAEKGLDVRKKTFLGIREKCFFLTSPLQKLQFAADSLGSSGRGFGLRQLETELGRFLA